MKIGFASPYYPLGMMYGCGLVLKFIESRLEMLTSLERVCAKRKFNDCMK